jgi:hypothetical protein
MLHDDIMRRLIFTVAAIAFFGPYVLVVSYGC